MVEASDQPRVVGRRGRFPHSAPRARGPAVEPSVPASEQQHEAECRELPEHHHKATGSYRELTAAQGWCCCCAVKVPGCAVEVPKAVAQGGQVVVLVVVVVVLLMSEVPCVVPFDQGVEPRHPASMVDDVVLPCAVMHAQGRVELLIQLQKPQHRPLLQQPRSQPVRRRPLSLRLLLSLEAAIFAVPRHGAGSRRTSADHL